MTLVITPDTIKRVREQAESLTAEDLTERDLAVTYRAVGNMRERAVFALVELLLKSDNKSDAFKDGITAAGDAVVDALTSLSAEEHDAAKDVFKHEGFEEPENTEESK